MNCEYTFVFVWFRTKAIYWVEWGGECGYSYSILHVLTAFYYSLDGKKQPEKFHSITTNITLWSHSWTNQSTTALSRITTIMLALAASSFAVPLIETNPERVYSLWSSGRQLDWGCGHQTVEIPSFYLWSFLNILLSMIIRLPRGQNAMPIYKQTRSDFCRYR